jgi:hypothetical protein
MRITASASAASRVRNAVTSRRWQSSDSARCSCECQDAARKARGMPATARIATASRGLPAASPMIRWNSSLPAMSRSMLAPSDSSHSCSSRAMSSVPMRRAASAAAAGSSSARTS